MNRKERKLCISDALKETIQEKVDSGKHESLFVGIIDNGDVDYYCYGKTAKDGNIIDENTIFEIGSISKVFTSLILADMVQEEVSLDDPVEKFLPEEVKVPSKDGKKITLLNLVTHTSDLPRMHSLLPDLKPGKKYEYTKDGMYDFLSDYELIGDIGLQFEYSNTGGSLLAHALSLQEGKSYEQTLKERILDRLGMDSTCVNKCDDLQNRFAKPHHLGKVVDELNLPDEMAGAGGIKIEWGKKLQNITTDKDDNDVAVVTAHFEDGTSSVSGDCIVGCDGLHSRTRKIIMPDAPAPKYSGNVAAGAFTPNQTKQPRNELTFHFGKKAYMIYFVTSKGEAMWGAHLNIDEESLSDIKSASSQQWKQRVSDLYDKDASYIGDFTKNEDNFTKIPLYDIESLSVWHKGLVCLVGDSAHSTTPHAGQGASIAMESALALAKCLRDIPNTKNAFTRYQQLRKDRVEKMIAMARRSGGTFTVTNPVGKLIRNIMIPFMLKRNPKEFDKIYGYKIDWDKKITSN